MHEPPESDSLLRYVGLVSSAVAAALFAVALCFPAFLTLAPERYTTLGWEALIGSAALILLIPGAISMIVTSFFSLCFEGELRAFGGIAEGVAVLLAALANPMFLASCVALAVRWLRTALATSTIALIGMTVSWWVVTKFNISGSTGFRGGSYLTANE